MMFKERKTTVWFKADDILATSTQCNVGDVTTEKLYLVSAYISLVNKGSIWNKKSFPCVRVNMK